MKKFVGLVVSAVAVIGLSSCGGDDGGTGSGSGSGDAQKVIDALVSSASETDVTIDEACVADVVNKLGTFPMRALPLLNQLLIAPLAADLG